MYVSFCEFINVSNIVKTTAVEQLVNIERSEHFKEWWRRDPSVSFHRDYRLVTTTYHVHECCVRSELHQVVFPEAVANENKPVTARREPAAQVVQFVFAEFQFGVNRQVVVATRFTEFDENVCQLSGIFLVVVTGDHEYIIVIRIYNTDI